MDLLKESDRDGIYIRHAITDAPDNRREAFHVHDRCEAYLFVSGNAQYLVEGSVYPLERGSLLIMRPGEAHCVRFLGEERYERYAVNFPLSLFDSFDPEHRLVRPYTERPLGEKNLYYQSGMEEIFHELCYYEGDDYGRTLLMTTRLAYVMERIRRQGADRQTKDLSLSAEIVRYVNSVLFEEITVEKLAEHFFLSTSQFTRLFRQASGTSPWSYIRAKRLIRARELLRDGFSAKDAAEHCGFGDYSVFYKAYVKRFKEKPSAFSL